MGWRSKQKNTIKLGDALFDVSSMDLKDLDGKPINLREKSRRVLQALAVKNGETVNRDELITTVWAGRAVTDDNLVQCIKDIRSALGDSDRRLLRTSIGRGYSLQGIRQMSSATSSLPTLLISKFQSTGDIAAVIELAEIVPEELVIALSPRVGFQVTRDIAQRAQAMFVIDGRVSLAGDAMRVFVQLLRGQTGAVAFAETWSIPIGAADEATNYISEKIASVLRVNMFNHAGDAFVDCDNASLNTQELLSKAAYHMSRIQLWNRDEARAALSVAVEQEPQNAMALAMRSSVGVISILQEGYAKLPEPPEYCMNLADRAFELAPQVDFMMLTRGCMRLWLRADHRAARADFDRALENNPVFHLAHQFRAVSEILSGEPIPAIKRLRKIIELGTVNNPRYPHYLTLLALAEIQTGAINSAFQYAREAHERAPSDPWCGYVFAASAADREDITQSGLFRRTQSEVGLSFNHFRELPFTKPQIVNTLEDRLIRSGYPR